MKTQKTAKSLKNLFLLNVVLILLIFNTSIAFADFYVIAGSRGVGTKITSLPYTISSSGFYFIDKDLACSTGTGIFIDANDVTLDLMGFSLDGSGGAGTYRGIYMSGRTNVEIRNGTIKNFNHYGIYEASNNGTGHRIINVRIKENVYGVFLNGKGHLIEKCTAINNGGAGISASGSSTVTGNICYGNATHGISVANGNASIVTGNTCFDNIRMGILASPSYGNIVKNNTCYNNGEDGIFVNKGATIIGNTCYMNGITGTDYGIYSFGGLVDQNAAYLNGDTGFRNIYPGGDNILGNNYFPLP